MSDLRQAAQQAILLCRWIDETPHQRGSINGMAAQVKHALEQALAEPEQERKPHPQQRDNRFYREKSDEYDAQNPLGGPAKVFDAIANAIRAGDDYHTTLRRFGFAEVNALAEPEQIAAHGCHIDLEPGQSADACVFDDGRIEDCAYAWKLQREGKGKEACAEWRPIKLIKPTPRKPLTDEEIASIVGECAASAHRHDDFSFARKVIAAYKAKNGITGEGA